MNDHDRSLSVNQQVLTMQCIAGALIAGVVLFAAITLFLGTWNAPERQGVLKYVGLLLPAIQVIPFLLVPKFITPASMQQASSDPEASREEQIGAVVGTWVSVYQTRIIVRLALLEGAAFLNLVAFLLEHARWSLALVGLLVLVMLAVFPTRTRLEHWIEAEIH